jgi:hypothetical protein
MTTTEASLGPASLLKQELLDFLSAFLRGVGRFLKILLGVKSASSHESATYLFLMLGFIVEGVVVFGLILERAAHDFSYFRYGFEKATLPAVILLISVTVLLFLHQFLIFRNFALVAESDRKEQRQEFAVEIGAAVASIEKSEIGSALSILKALPIFRTAASPPAGRRPRALLLTWIERLVFLFFGVLTGEAGYCLTVLHEHHEAGWLVDGLQRVLGTASWGLTLGCVFLACAAAVCLLVLVWDLAAAFSAETRARLGKRLKHFIIDDLLSFLFWISLFCVVTPEVRLMLGVQGEYPVIATLGWCSLVWVFLLFFSVWYVLALGKRLLSATAALASEPTYDDARQIII